MGRKKVDVSDLRTKAKERLEDPKPVGYTDEQIQRILDPSAWKQHQTILRFWREFAEEILDEKDPDRTCKTLTQLPSVNNAELFLLWLARTREGQICDRISVTLLKNRLDHLKRTVGLYSCQAFTKEEAKYLRKYVLKVLPLTEGVSRKKYSKPLAGLDVTEDLIHYLWKADEHEYSHPRVRLQLAFSLILFSYLGSRPGEVVESECWRKSNEGLCYKDIELSRQLNDDFDGLIMQVKLRNRKNQRNDESQEPIFTLYEEKEMRHLCPVTHFLSLALMDGALDCKTINEVESKRIPRGKESYRFRIEPEWREVPILRSVEPDGSISKTRILTYGNLNKMIQGLGERASYPEKLTSYCFRRAVGNTANRNVSGQTLRHWMGHLNKASYQYYHSASSGIDIQSIIHNRKPKEKLIQANQSMKLRRDVGAPQPPGALLTDVVGPRTVDKDASHLGKRQQYDLAKKAQRLDFNERRKAFFEKENEGNQESESEDEEEEADDDNIVIVEAKTDIRSPSRYLRAFLRYESNRQKIIDVLFTKQGSSMIDIIGALIRLRYRERERIEYPKAPIGDGDRCPDCNKQLRIPKVRLDRTHSHLLGCARSRFIKEGRKNMKHRFENSLGSCQWNDCGYKFKLKSDGTYTNHVSNHLIRNKSNQCLWGHCGFLAPSIQELALHVSEKHGVPNDLTTPTRMYFCYEHGQYFAAEFDWLKHCALHRDRLTDFCGLIRRHGIVMVGAHCLFCLNDGGLDFGSRWRQFADPFTLHVHMKEHLASSGPPSTCPHPKCDDKLGSESAFWAHASSVHGIPPLGPTRDRKRNATDDEDDAGGEASKRCRALNES